MTKKEKFKFTSKHAKALLKERFSDTNKNIIAFEVGDGTGLERCRSIDAVSMELWPSKGHKLVAYEIKVSRADWLNELKTPEKSHFFEQNCDEFYLVAPEGVLKAGELPPNWGYIKVTEKSLTTKIKAVASNIDTVDKSFLASLARSFARASNNKDLMEGVYQRAYSNAKADVEKRLIGRADMYQKRYDELLERVRSFELKTGLRVENKWDVETEKNFQIIKKASELTNKTKAAAREISGLESRIARGTKALEELSQIISSLKEVIEESD